MLPCCSSYQKHHCDRCRGREKGLERANTRPLTRVSFHFQLVIKKPPFIHLPEQKQLSLRRVTDNI